MRGSQRAPSGEDRNVISDEDDWRFKQRLDRMERRFPSLMAHPHYGPLMIQEGHVELLEEMRIEWRERQERARARALKWDASIADG
jgi:hypothetical protein